MKTIVDSLKVLGESTRMFESLRDNLFAPKGLKFNSQICTTREQSGRLIALGLKKETADMYYSYDIICAKPYHKVVEFMNGCVSEDIFPAWSLHRLIEMCDINPFIFYTNCGYDNVVDRIEELIKEGYFNKEYLV